MHFKKAHGGNTYYACCPICLSILQKQPKRYIAALAAGRAGKKYG